MQKIKLMVKNSGIVIVTFTVVAGVIYTILDLHIIVVMQENLWLRAVGVIIVAIVAYVPYFVFQKILVNTKFLHFFLGLWCIFFVVDIVIRFDLMFAFLQLPGFFGIVVYPLLFVGIVGVLFTGEIFIRKCTQKKYYCYRLAGTMKTKYLEIVPKRKKI